MRLLAWIILFVVAEAMVAMASGGCSEPPASGPRVVPGPVQPADPPPGTDAPARKVDPYDFV